MYSVTDWEGQRLGKYILPRWGATVAEPCLCMYLYKCVCVCMRGRRWGGGVITILPGHLDEQRPLSYSGPVQDPLLAENVQFLNRNFTDVPQVALQSPHGAHSVQEPSAKKTMVSFHPPFVQTENYRLTRHVCVHTAAEGFTTQNAIATDPQVWKNILQIQ